MARLTPPRPLVAEDDTSTFDCGRASMNLWLRRHAWRNQQSDVSRTSVVCDVMDGRVIGFVSLSMAQIERSWLAKSLQRNRPDPVPAVLLGQLAVDLAWQGHGVARSLLHFALTTAVRLSKDVGCFCVLTHPLDDGVRAFYGAWGFEDLPYDPSKSMVVRMVDLVQNGFEVGGAEGKD